MKPLYHGTIYEFDSIDVTAGKGYKDFGKGFYATAVPSHAERLAIRNKSIAEKRQSFLKNKKGIKIQPIKAYRYNLIFKACEMNEVLEMAKKSDLLKELGWTDDLIRHYMVENADTREIGNEELIAEVHDTHSMTVTFSAENQAGSSFVIKCE